MYNLVNSAIEIVAEHPEIGRETDEPDISAKIVRDYMIFYRHNELQISVLAIWDTRQNPEKIEQLLK